jgi:hypothetical protein
MFGRKKDSPEQDAATKQLQSSGVYALGHGPHPFVVENEAVDAVKTRKIYSLRSGVWYTSVLSALLFWLPPFGQMVAGYVGGRKAGTPKLGVLAALAPMSILFVLFGLKLMGLFVAQIDWMLGLPGQGADYVASSAPVLGPLFGFAADYARSFIATTWSQDYFIYPYVLTVIFGYVGGVLSLQRRREMDAQGEHGAFQPIVIAPHVAAPQPAVAASEPAPVAPERSKQWKMKKDKHKGKW